MNEDAPLTLSIPEAGKKYFGLSRNGAYDAAARGELPPIRIGRHRARYGIPGHVPAETYGRLVFRHREFDAR